MSLDFIESDLYQHSLSKDSKHHISLFNDCTFEFIDIFCSTESVEDDDCFFTSHPQPVPTLIDGALQRALVLCYHEIDTQTLTPKQSKSEMGRQRICMEHKETVSIDNWFDTFQHEPHFHEYNDDNHTQLRPKGKHRKYVRHKHWESNICSTQMKKLNQLRGLLPSNPCELRENFRTRSIALQSNFASNSSTIKEEIGNIRQRILMLQKQLCVIRDMQTNKEQLKNWKSFKGKWANWRLIDFYEYLIRINHCKYERALQSFDMFYLNWMGIVNNDRKTMDSRFASPHFEGRNVLPSLDHSDLFAFGVISIMSRREILSKIHALIAHIK